MQVYLRKAAMNEEIARLKKEQKTIGFVPTMGALHDGHLSLLSQALEENEVAVVSIFVNPTQFNNSEDLEKYPRNLTKDLETIDQLSDKIIVFAPNADDFYDGNVVSDSYNYDGLEFQMEGKNRPGHFDGVGTVVEKLFRIVCPDKAYFGEKDFQQLQIIRKLVEKKGLPIQIIGCPIFRQTDGLAMSSRNERLSKEQRKEATLIYQTLRKVKEQFCSHPIDMLIQMVEQTFEKHPAFTLEYFVFADEKTLQVPHQKSENTTYRAFIVAHIGGVRLIDNMQMPNCF